MVSSRQVIDRGLQYFNAGDLDRAEQTLQGVVRDDPRHARGWLLLGLVRQARGQPEEALTHYRLAVTLDPKCADAYNNMGWAYNQLRRPDEAAAALGEALRLRPNLPEAHNNLGNTCLLQGKPEEALACFRRAFGLSPAFGEALNNAALVLIPRGRLDEAFEVLEQALRARPDNADALINLAWAHLEKGEPERCLEAARQALLLNPRSASAHNNAGTALLRLGRTAEAARHFLEAVRLWPDFPQAAGNLGVALLNLGQAEGAAHWLSRAARLQPDNAGLLNDLALALTRLGRWDQAGQAASRALQLRPDFPEALNNLGLCLLSLQQSRRAFAALQEAVRLRPAFPEALSNLGWALIEDGQAEAAVTTLLKALDVRPDMPDALNNLGLAYDQLNRPEDARAAYERAVAARPDFPEALGGLANVYKNLGRVDEAIALYRRSLALNPRQGTTYSNFLFALHYPAAVTPEEIFREHQQWARHNAEPLAACIRPHPNDPNPERRLRVGYVSADFRGHVMGWYVEPVLEAHDRARFEVFCYSNTAKPDDTTGRLRGLAEHWREVYRVPDEAVEEMIRRDGIDLLLDLNGHTGGNRITLFARKPAPVQAAHFGYMESSGLPAIDYRISDAVCDPPGMTERYHSEQLVRLPEILWVYRPNVPVEVNPPPAATAGHVTFGMFNAFPKVTTPCVAAWSEILRRLPGSRLVLLGGVSPQADARLADAFAAQGMGPDRVEVVGRQSRADYFRLYHRVDLTLDTFPYAGCNTTCDSLWMGVPVVTLLGRTCMTRQGASPLAHLGLHELIAETTEAYVETAKRFARDLPRLAQMRATLRARMEGTTLMNPERFTRQLEEAYRWMWRQWCARAAAGAHA